MVIVRFAFGEGILESVIDADADASGGLKVIGEGVFCGEERVESRCRAEVVEHVENVVVKRRQGREFQESERRRGRLGGADGCGRAG